MWLVNYSAAFYYYPSLPTACLLLHSPSFSISVSLLNPSFFFSCCRSTQGQIIIISKPFARSLPANPMFGLMSHAPHLPWWGVAWGPFHKHWPRTTGLPCGATRPLDLGGGVFLQDKQGSRDPAEWKLKDRVWSVNVDKIFSWIRVFRLVFAWKDCIHSD